MSDNAQDDLLQFITASKPTIAAPSQNSQNSAKKPLAFVTIKQQTKIIEKKPDTNDEIDEHETKTKNIEKEEKTPLVKATVKDAADDSDNSENNNDDEHENEKKRKKNSQSNEKEKVNTNVQENTQNNIKKKSNDCQFVFMKSKDVAYLILKDQIIDGDQKKKIVEEVNKIKNNKNEQLHIVVENNDDDNDLAKNGVEAVEIIDKEKNLEKTVELFKVFRDNSQLICKEIDVAVFSEIVKIDFSEIEPELLIDFSVLMDYYSLIITFTLLDEQAAYNSYNNGKLDPQNFPHLIKMYDAAKIIEQMHRHNVASLILRIKETKMAAIFQKIIEAKQVHRMNPSKQDANSLWLSDVTSKKIKKRHLVFYMLLNEKDVEEFSKKMKEIEENQGKRSSKSAGGGSNSTPNLSSATSGSGGKCR